MGADPTTRPDHPLRPRERLAQPPRPRRRHGKRAVAFATDESPTLWAPFLIGSVGGVALAVLSVPIAGFFGVDFFAIFGVPLYAGWPVLSVAGPAFGFVAATASRSWRGLLTLVLGFAWAGAVLGVFSVLGTEKVEVAEVAFYTALVLGYLGIPTYLIVVGAIRLIDRPRKPNGV